ncbi:MULTISPECIES: DUF2336 domain-containing protein [Sphingomonas]|uniref:DUF2336 domain-containing protein n=1 Tax=Sphingomonas TaxID=13687 RepID=UPI000829DE25|nr:DUF2336 domain-containing protein [Sphingomonas sp. CCH10-B3]
MSIDRGDMNDGLPPDASRLLARGAADDVRARRRIVAASADLHLDETERLDDRYRTALHHMIAALVALIETDLRQYAARQLVARGMPEPALAMSEATLMADGALRDAGLLDDPDFMRAMLGRTGLALLAERLPLATAANDRPSLLVRLAEHRDGVVAAAAKALLAADARRREAVDGAAPRNDIAAEQQHQLVWWTAAAIHRDFAETCESMADFDRALTEAATRALSVHDEAERAEAAAMRLVAMLAPQPGERADLLYEALADRRPALFVAVLAQALELDFDQVRDVVIDPDSDRLWVMLRAAALERDTIARLGLALCEAMPGRDVEAFADRLDTIMAVTPVAAEAALAPLRRHTDLRTALARMGNRR